MASADMVEELDLSDGVGFAWCGAKFRYRGAAVLEEIAATERDGPGATSAAPATGFEGTDAVLFKRVAAGLLVETGLADKKTAKRWQSAVLQQSWDADACAEEILSHPGARAALSDPKLLSRADRLERDFLMASFQRGIRGASRRQGGGEEHHVVLRGERDRDPGLQRHHHGSAHRGSRGLRLEPGRDRRQNGGRPPGSLRRMRATRR